VGEHFLRILGHNVFATACVCILVYNTIGFTRFKGGRQPPACAADVDLNMLGFCKGAGDEVDGERGGDTGVEPSTLER
jgi:hypothetical protein